MIKKIMVISLVAFICTVNLSARRRSTRHKDVITFMKSSTYRSNTLTKNLKGARSESKVARVLYGYVRLYKDVNYRSKWFEVKYPELEGDKNPPHLKKVTDKFQNSFSELSKIVIAKLTEYAKFRSVQKASLKVSTMDGGKYAEAVDAIMYGTIIHEYFYASLKAARSAKHVAAAINYYADNVAKFNKKIGVVDKKFPELDKMKTPPQSLKEATEKLQKVTGSIESQMGAIKKYGADPAVQKAAARLK